MKTARMIRTDSVLRKRKICTGRKSVSAHYRNIAFSVATLSLDKCEATGKCTLSHKSPPQAHSLLRSCAIAANFSRTG
jgi:hypothetical protein